MKSLGKKEFFPILVTKLFSSYEKKNDYGELLINAHRKDRGRKEGQNEPWKQFLLNLKDQRHLSLNLE